MARIYVTIQQPRYGFVYRCNSLGLVYALYQELG